MAWTPTFKVLRPAKIANNLLAYIATNQADALSWATGGTALRPIQEFSDSTANRTSPVYPSIARASNEGADDDTEDYLPAAFSLIFEVMIQNADPSTAVTEAENYEAAIKSMIRNCPDATVMANTGIANVVLESIETSFDEIKTNEMQNDFLQVFQLRLTYTMFGEAR